MDLNKPVFKEFPEAKIKVASGFCPMCNKQVGQFKDASSEKEYKVSGLCQTCQDKVFGG